LKTGDPLAKSHQRYRAKTQLPITSAQDRKAILGTLLVLESHFN